MTWGVSSLESHPLYLKELSKWRGIWSIQKPLFWGVWPRHCKFYPNNCTATVQGERPLFWTCTNCRLAPGKVYCFCRLIFLKCLQEIKKISHRGIQFLIRIFAICEKSYLHMTSCVLHEKQGQPHKTPTFEKEFSGTEAFFRRRKLFNLVQEAWR